MKTSIVVVDDPRQWTPEIPEVAVISAREYLTDPVWSEEVGVRVFNLCRSYRYQSAGYYVSLLAVARGHIPNPSLTTVLDMRSRAVVRIVDEELEELIGRTLSHLRSDKFELGIYFGKCPTKRYQRMCSQIFARFQAPIFDVRFVRDDDVWHLSGVAPIAASRIPERHREFVVAAANGYIGRPQFRDRRRRFRYDLALLVAEDDPMAPSDEKALRRFTRASEAIGLRVERITRDDLSRIAEFDALYIRETTYVNRHTYRFAQRAEAERLIVIDDPQSIIKCTNKVYLAELLTRRKVSIPVTVIGHRGNLDEIADRTGLPCVLKSPDSSFSQGVIKVTTEEELLDAAAKMLESSDLFVAQEWMPTSFDWRVGVFDGHPLWVCRYHMARGHWQIIKSSDQGRFSYGKVESVAVEDAPARVIRTALRAAGSIGNGLYGVDIKESGRRIVVMEVNDNPNIEAGMEDKILGMELHRRMAAVFLERIDALKGIKSR